MGNQVVLNEENLLQRILFIRGKRVILDVDLAQMYQIETRVLKQQVKRNLDRFPPDFMFELTRVEIDFVVSQNVIPSKRNFGGSNPFVFTELGVAMLSSILNSKRAIHVNISIMRAFVSLRQMIETNRELSRRIDEMEEKYDEHFRQVFEAIRELIGIKKQPMKRIGYRLSKSEE